VFVGRRIEDLALLSVLASNLTGRVCVDWREKKERV